MTDLELFRVYTADECGKDGYPLEWHATIKDLVREEAGHRCVRCKHPYRKGEHGNGEWSPCDEDCDHHGPLRVMIDEGDEWIEHPDDAPWAPHAGDIADLGVAHAIEAAWRILTVHHLDGDKKNCCWWNLVALCQRCHLQIQGKVLMARVWPWEHTPWFHPYVAGYYAHVYLGERLTRGEVDARVDELLALERAA